MSIHEREPNEDPADYGEEAAGREPEIDPCAVEDGGEISSPSDPAASSPAPDAPASPDLSLEPASGPNRNASSAEPPSDVLDLLELEENRSPGAEGTESSLSASQEATVYASGETQESASPDTPSASGSIFDYLEEHEQLIPTVEGPDPNEWQAQAITLPVDRAVRVIAPPGSGKCLAPGTPVLMLDGTIKAVEDISVGDQLMGPDSCSRTVLSLAHGYEEMFEIIPVKGDSFTCNRSHILSLVWSGTHYSNRAKKPDGGGDGAIHNISVSEYLSRSNYTRERLKLYRAPVDFPDVDVSVPPYFLGLWLGDGHAHITSLTTAESELVEYLDLIADQYDLRIRRDSHRNLIYHLVGDWHAGPGSNRLRNEMLALDVIENKHVPQLYKCSSRAVRLELLAGLLDSDGHLQGNCFEIIQRRARLIDDIAYLARSLGLAAYVSEKLVDGETYYRLSISGDVSMIPTRLARKQAPPRKQIKSVLRTGIARVISKGVGEYFGFSLSGNGLFLLGDFTVTHNTFVLVRRLKFLLENGLSMRNIVAVTLTKKMATELYVRFVALYPEMQDDTWASKNICTIHALCFRILKEEGDGRDVVKGWEYKRLLQELIEPLYPEVDERPGWREVASAIDSAKYHNIPANKTDLANFYMRRLGGGNHAINVANIHLQRDERMRAMRALTFADMLADIEHRLEADEGFRKKWQGRLKAVLVDEGQDTNGQAMRILTRLAAPQDQFYIVGDTDQLLYRFAGATPEINMLEGFERRFPDHETVQLKINYRSSQAIVKAANALVAHNYASGGGPYDDRYRKEQISHPDASPGEPVSFAEYESPEAEARALVENIQVLVGPDEGIEFDDIFVGARTRAQLAYLEGPLAKAEIPYINASGRSFWESRHVKELVAYLRLAHDHNDDEAFQTVFNIGSVHSVHPWGESKGQYCPHRYLGRAFLNQCQNEYTRVRQAVNAYKFPWKYSFRPGSEDLVQLVDDIRTSLLVEGTADTLRFIMTECYDRYLRVEHGVVNEGDGGAYEDIETLIEIARDFQSPQDFIDHVATMAERAAAARAADWDGHVILMTVHAMKGLERRVVFGIGLGEGEQIVGEHLLPAGLLPHTFSLTNPPQFGVFPADPMGRIEDERCIAYVLLTRAKEQAHFSTCQRYRNSDLSRSRFIDEMGIRVQA